MHATCPLISPFIKWPIYNTWLFILRRSPACGYVLTLTSEHFLKYSLLQHTQSHFHKARHRMSHKTKSKVTLKLRIEEKIMILNRMVASNIRIYELRHVVMDSLRAVPLLGNMLQYSTGTNWSLYRMSQEECARLREGVPYVKVYRYNPKHLYPKLNGYGDNGQRRLKLSQLLHTYWLPNTY